MAIRDDFALPGNARGVPSAGDGGPGYDAIEPSERLAASVGKESAHGDVSHYVAAKQAASGVKPGGGAGFGMYPPDDDSEDDARFDTSGGNDESMSPDYSQVPSDSNLMAGGRELGA